MGRLETAWQEAVFALYLAEDKITPEVVENMRTWPHSGFRGAAAATATAPLATICGTSADRSRGGGVASFGGPRRAVWRSVVAAADSEEARPLFDVL